VGLVDVDVSNVGGGAARDDPALEEVEDELLVGGAEAESRRPPARRRGLHLADGWWRAGVSSAGSTDAPAT
jgi:hypothetical protein